MGSGRSARPVPDLREHEMTKTRSTAYVADITADQFAAVERHARKLRSEAVRDAFRRAAAWFRAAPTSAGTPTAGRTA